MRFSLKTISPPWILKYLQSKEGTMVKRLGWILILLMVMTTMSVFAQRSQVTGDVLQKDGQPAINYTVSLAGKFAFTDVRGRFRILDVAYGKYNLQVSRNKKVLATIAVTINQVNTRIPRIQLPR
jgi:hypothetical protein